MYKVIKQIIPVFLLLALFSFTNKKGESDKILIGTGGGFTGKVTSYTIDKKGNIHLQKGLNNENQLLGKLKGKDLCAIKKTIKKSGFKDIEINEPGNIYYFIETINKNGSHKVIWGSGETEELKKMKDLYTFIMEKINKLNR